MRRGQPVGQDALVDMLWGDAPPTAVTATLQGYVARLRRALEPDRAPRAPSEVLVTQQSGYALILPEEALDAARFEAAVSSAHDRLGTGMTAGLDAAELEQLFASLNEGLSLVARSALHRARGRPGRPGGARPARRAARDRARGPGRRGTRARTPRDGGRRARGADRDLPAARAAVGAAGAGVDALGATGRRAGGAPAGARAARRRAGPGAGGGAALVADGRAPTGPLARVDRRQVHPATARRRLRPPGASPGRWSVATTSSPPWSGCSSSPTSNRCSPSSRASPASARADCAPSSPRRPQQKE